MNGRMGSRTMGRALSASLLLAAALSPTAALADVRHEGSWDDDPEVTLDLEHTPRAEAVRKLAVAAGWSVVLDNVPMGDPVDLHLDEQPAGKVIDLLLTDGHYVARRDGKLLVIRRADAPTVAPATPSAPKGASSAAPVLPAPPVPPVPPTPPVAPLPPEPPAAPASTAPSAEEKSERGRDREVFGANLRIDKGEVVDDVSVVGGNVDVYGTITGDLMVTGGNARIHEGARVMGDATTMGGSITIDDRARIDGDVDTIGGSLKRAKGAEIRGDVKVDQRRSGHGRDEGEGHFFQDAGAAITRTALLFVFGAVLLSLAGERTDRLKAQLAAHPMRSFATGVVASLAFGAILVALCVTVVGIPFALIGALGGFVAIAAGLCAALETLGGALLGHRTRNPYVHLAFGCAVFLVVGAIPFLGGLVKAALLLAGIGSVAATRAAGFFPAKNRPNGSPYREPQAL